MANLLFIRLEWQTVGGGCKGIGALSDVQDSLEDTENIPHKDVICAKRCCLRETAMTRALSSVEMIFANLVFHIAFLIRNQRIQGFL